MRVIVESSSKELMDFIRLRVCLYVTSISVFGFLLFNPVNTNLFPVIFASFMATASMYSFNQLSDREEDLLNKKKLNRFVLNGKGPYVVVASLVSGMVSAILLSIISVLFLVLSIALGMVYSMVRVKKISLIKNIYAMLSISLMFLVGATASSGSVITVGLIEAYLVLSIYVLTISIMADLRDYKGDRLAGVKTIPVIFGCGAGKMIICFLFALFSISVVIGKMVGFYILLLFVPFILVYLLRDNIWRAYNLLSISFLSLPVSAFIIIP